MASWSFSNWFSNDQIVIYGSSGADTITGNDAAGVTFVGGAGADTLNGGAANDIFAYVDQGDIQPGEVIDGGGGINLILVAGGHSYDFSGATIANVTELLFTDNGTTAIFNQDQVASFAINAVSGDPSGTSSGETLIVDGSVVDLSTLSFNNWNGTDQVQINGTAAGDQLTGSSVNDTIDGEAETTPSPAAADDDRFVFDSALSKTEPMSTTSPTSATLSAPTAGQRASFCRAGATARSTTDRLKDERAISQAGGEILIAGSTIRRSHARRASD